MKSMLVFTVLCLIVSCSNDGDTPAAADGSQLSGAVRMDGSSTVFPIRDTVKWSLKLKAFRGYNHLSPIKPNAYSGYGSSTVNLAMRVSNKSMKH